MLNDLNATFEEGKVCWETGEETIPLSLIGSDSPTKESVFTGQEQAVIIQWIAGVMFTGLVFKKNQ